MTELDHRMSSEHPDILGIPVQFLSHTQSVWNAFAGGWTDYGLVRWGQVFGAV